jgi:DNA-binding ferritin-like protein (Dps family)
MTDLLKIIQVALNESEKEAETSSAGVNIKPVYDAIKAANITDRQLLSFRDGWDTIQQQARTMADIIQQFRPKYGIQSDLTGDDLVEQMAQSLVRLKLYFYLAMDLYQYQMDRYGGIRADSLGASLRKPKDKNLIDMFKQLPDEFKRIVLEKDDILSNALMVDFEESVILKEILKLVEDVNTDISSLIADDQNTAMDILFNEAFNKFIRAFLFANVKDLAKIDEDIYLRFSNPSKINTRLRDIKLKAQGVKKVRGENDTKSDLYTKYEPVTGEGRGEIVNDLSNLPEPAEADPQLTNPDLLDAITYEPKNKKEEKDKEVIFSHSNLLLKYFNTPNWASIAAELLERLMINPGSKIKVFNTADLKFEDKNFLKMALDDTDTYLEDTVVRASLLTFELLSNTADLLITITGEPVEINEEVLGKVRAALIQSTEERSTQWFKIRDLPSRYKEELRQALKLDTIPSFIVSTNNALKGNTVKEKILDLLRREMLTADQARKNDLADIIREIEKTEDQVRIEGLAKIAKIKPQTLSNILGNTRPENAVATPTIASPEEKKLAKKIGDTLYDKFGVFIPNSVNKAFEYNGRAYVGRPEIAAFVSTMSPENLNKLWQDIKSGAITMSDKNNTPFMNQTGGPGQASINSFTAAIKELLKLRGVMTEAVAVKEDPSLDLENAYIAFFTQQAAPILQHTLVELKKLSSFLVAMVRLFNAYNNYLARGSNAKHKYMALSNEELEEIEDLQDFFVSGPNKHNFAGNQLVDDLRNIRIDEVMVSRIVNAYEANKDNPAYTSPINDPEMQTAFRLFKEWVMAVFSGDTKTTFERAFDKYEQTGNINMLREVLSKNKNEIEARLKDSGYGFGTGYMSKLRIMNEIIRGTFGTPFAGKKEAPVETGATQKVNPLSNFSF